MSNRKSAYDASTGGFKRIHQYIQEKKEKELSERKIPRSPYQPSKLPSYVKML